jgi:tetratricopeptide (TPR) repeat protein
MAERLAYLPSAGFCLLAASLWARLEERDWRIAWTVLTALVVALGVRTVVRNRDWRSNDSLYAADVKAVPGSAKAHSNLAIQYYFRNDLERASREAKIALRIYPDLPDAVGYEGLVEARLGNDLAARQLLEKALKNTLPANPNYDFIAINLAAVLMKLGEYDQALALLNTEIEKTPGLTRAWSNRAVIFYRRGEIARARSDAETAIRIDSENTQARNLLGLLDQNVIPSAQR